MPETRRKPSKHVRNRHQSDNVQGGEMLIRKVGEAMEQGEERFRKVEERDFWD